MSHRPAREAHQYQREFINWLAAADFGDRTVKVRRTVHYLRVEVPSLNPAIVITLRTTNLAADVYWRGQHIDRIFDEDLIPVRDGDAYICRLCEGNPERTEPPPRFASIAAMRRDHLFETLRAWCVERLFPAQYIHITMQRRHFSSAKLSKEICEPSITADGVQQFSLPLWNAIP